jgi:2-keto-4-pentenoate hydratase/2-oxohepta-3-ene-1,7-dioic acid hydratase in catechol pathway
MNDKNIPGLDIPIKSIYCIGRNYSEHAKELNNPVPDSPIVFLKPQSSICYDGDQIKLPAQSKDVHHEVELVIAISKKGKDISEEHALDYIHGAGVGIDFTARDIQQKAKEKGHPWSVAKGFDTFAPISKFIQLDKLPNLDNLGIELLVNDQIRQSGNSSQMIFSVPYLISYLSQIFTLYPGDLIFTGTPSGVSSIKKGDVIHASLGNNLTSLSVTVE